MTESQCKSAVALDEHLKRITRIEERVREGFAKIYYPPNYSVPEKDTVKNIANINERMNNDILIAIGDAREKTKEEIENL